jgi:hypothetical protein
MSGMSVFPSAVLICPAVKGYRINRHNGICGILTDRLKDKGWKVALEPRIKTADGKTLIPDIIAVIQLFEHLWPKALCPLPATFSLRHRFASSCLHLAPLFGFAGTFILKLSASVLLNQYAIGRLQFYLSQVETSQGKLLEMDLTVRRYAKQWLKLPECATDHILYAGTDKGGLSLPPVMKSPSLK